MLESQDPMSKKPSQPGFPMSSQGLNRGGEMPISQQPGSMAAISYPVQIFSYFGKDPTFRTCPHCRQEFLTITRPNPGTLTYLSCVFLCMTGCFAGCCLFPFCMDSLQDIEHLCPKCNHALGVHKRLR